MGQFDWNVLLSSIQRCNAAYCEDEISTRRQFAAMGAEVIAWCSDIQHQAVLSIPADGVLTLTNAGTRMSEGNSYNAVADLWQDVDFTPLVVPGGRVAAGAHMRAQKTYPWALEHLPDGQMLRVEGHSLGGQETHLAPLFIPAPRLHSMIAWEPPKAGDLAYYTSQGQAFAKCTTALNGSDPWMAWPWSEETLQHPPGPLLWLHDGTWAWVKYEEWPGGSVLHFSDHDEGAVIAAVQRAMLVG